MTDGVNGGGMFVTAPLGLPEPLAPVLLLLSASASRSSLTLLVVAFLPFFADLGFAGVFFFSGDTVIGCSSEWRERYHRQSPLWSPRSPVKGLVEKLERSGLMGVYAAYRLVGYLDGGARTWRTYPL